MILFYKIKGMRFMTESISIGREVAVSVPGNRQSYLAKTYLSPISLNHNRSHLCALIGSLPFHLLPEMSVMRMFLVE